MNTLLSGRKTKSSKGYFGDLEGTRSHNPQKCLHSPEKTGAPELRGFPGAPVREGLKALPPPHTLQKASAEALQQKKNQINLTLVPAAFFF